MHCTKPATGMFLIAALAMLVVVAPCCADGKSDARKRSDKNKAHRIRLALPQAVEIALNRNLRVRDARTAVRESKYQEQEAYSDMFPSLNVQYSASADRYRGGLSSGSNARVLSGIHASRWIIREVAGPPFVITPNYPYRIDPYRTFTLTATLSQPIYNAGKLLNNYKYARLGVDYSKIQLEIEKQDLTLDVYQAYYGLTEAEKLLEVADQSIVALESLRNQTREFLRAGVVAKVDLLSTEGQLAQARIQRTQALTEIERNRALLNFLLRNPQETPIEIVHDLRYTSSPYSIPRIYSVAAANRLEIRQASISVEQAMAIVKAAGASLLPSVSLQVQGSRINDDWNVLDPEGANDWTIMGVLSWSFNMFRNKDTVQEKRASHARAFLDREKLVEQIMEEVKEAYVDMKRAQSDIADNRKAVEYREEAFRINKESYKEKLSTYTQVLDAQRELARAQGDYYSSLIRYKLGWALLERRMGILK